MTDYDKVTEQLSGMEAQATAAECHGFLCGLACRISSLSSRDWQEFLGLQKAATKDTSLLWQIEDLWKQIGTGLESDDLSFSLLLPDPKGRLQLRARALAEWCGGFLNGYGIGSKHRTEKLTDECRELLEDFAGISRMQVPATADDSDEHALMELEEFVRVGVLNLHGEFLQYKNRQVRTGAEKDEP